jgi:hypothetical protein
VKVEDDFDQAEQLYNTILNALKKNQWFRFPPGRINEDKRNRDVFLVYNVYSEDDLDKCVRKFSKFYMFFEN